MAKNRTRITGIGSALTDILINETDDFLINLQKEKGGMTIVQDKDIQNILSYSNQNKKPIVVCGGASCNTIIGVAKLGGKARFIGMRGEDSYGKIFEDNLIKSNVEPLISISDTSTGKVLSVITPDGQRSMFTFLGASALLLPDMIKPEMFENTAIALIEGYLLFNPNLIMAALKAAKKAGCLIALDLASFEIVNASKKILKNIVKNFVDILIANEDEAKAYTGFEDEINALKSLSLNVDYAVLKLGAKGSLIMFDNKITRVEAFKGKNPIIDTTGAGDLWASGFLFGIANGLNIEKSGYIASACGYEVCQVIGAQVPDSAWARIKNLRY